MTDNLAYPLSWPKENAPSIRAILLEMDRPPFVGWPVTLSAPMPGSERPAPLRVKISGQPIG